MGINIKQVLSLFGYEKIEVNWLDVNPENPNDVFAATWSGLLRSRDGGESWPTVFPGNSIAERQVHCVARNPHNNREVYIGTQGGLMISQDGGESFVRVVDQRLAWMASLIIKFHPQDPNTIYIGTTSGLFRSTDGGKNFTWQWVTPLPQQNFIRRISVDPGDSQRVILGTMDGLFMTEDGGKFFTRTGGLVMTAEDIRGLTTSGRPQHFVAATNFDLWETTDGGKNWRILYYGNNEWSHQWAAYDPVDRNKLWLVNSAELLMLTPRKVRDLPPDLLLRFRKLQSQEPTSMEAIRTALKRAGLDRPSILNPYRERAMLKALVPKIQAGFYLRSVDGYSSRWHSLYAFPLPFVNRNNLDYFGFSVVAYWDLTDLVFNKQTLVVDRYFTSAGTRWGEWSFRHTIKELYLERRRLQLEAMVEKQTDFRAKLYRDLRIEELTAHMNQLCGDIFEEYWAF